MKHMTQTVVFLLAAVAAHATHLYTVCRPGCCAH